MFYTIPILSWLLFSLATSAEALRKAGEFRNYAHGIGGQVYVKDESTLVIKGFTYDGAGPDAFFWTGTSGSPSSVGTILPYPFKGKFYDYDDNSAPILTGRFSGDQEITLTLPSDLKSSDIKWLSVWCRAFHVNFGDMIFADDLVSIPEEVPPPLIEPIHNAHDPNRHDEDWKEDADAESSASEPESESEPGSASTMSGPLVSSLLSAALIYFLL